MCVSSHDGVFLKPEAPGLVTREVCHLENLQSLNLARARLKMLPANIGDLKGLQSLALRAGYRYSQMRAQDLRDVI